MKIRFWLLYIIIIIGLSMGCSAPPENSPTEPSLILLITVDSLRADVLSGQAGETTAPSFHRLAQQAHRFDRAYSPCSWTKPAMASFLTSSLVSQHLVFFTTLDRPSVVAYLGQRFDSDLGALYRRGNVLPNHLPLFHEGLGDYQRMAVAENVHLRTELGFARGWDRFENLPSRKAEPGIPSNADVVNERALSLIDQHGGDKILLWLHYFDVHWPYGPVDKYGTEIMGPLLDELPSPLTHAALDELGDQGPGTAFASEALPLFYRVGVRHFDDHLGELFDALDSRGRLDEALVVLTSDHGDEFFEHGDLGHGKNLYDTTIHIPLLIKLPGQKTASRHDDIVSLVDIGPTVLDLLEREIPASFDGRSLVPLLRGEQLPAGVAISEVVNRKLEPLKAVMAGDRKLIVGPDEQDDELTPLTDDGLILHGEAEQIIELRRLLMNAVGQWDLLEILAGEELHENDSVIENSEEIEAQLEALGYL